MSNEEFNTMDSVIDPSIATTEVISGSNEVDIDISMSGTESQENDVIAEIPSAFYGGFVKILSFLAPRYVIARHVFY